MRSRWDSPTWSSCRSRSTPSTGRGGPTAPGPSRPPAPTARPRAPSSPPTTPAPPGRYGAPQDLMFLVDTLHQRGMGVILDWVPSHFPTDEHGLAYFDGTHLYEHADRRQGHQPDWDSFVFNYGRHEVRSFLVSS